MYSTWNIPSEYKGACSGADQVGKVPLNLKSKKTLTFQDMDTTTIVYNSYYQWVPLYLIFLALLFYLPRYSERSHQ